MSKLTLTKGLQMHTNQIILSFLAPGCKTGCKKWDWFDPHWLPSQNWTMSHTHHSKDKPGTKLTLENKAKARKQSQFVVLKMGLCTEIYTPGFVQNCEILRLARLILVLPTSKPENIKHLLLLHSSHPPASQTYLSKEFQLFSSTIFIQNL